MNEQSIITVTNTEEGIKIEVSHNPNPTGPREDWSGPQLIVERMVRMFMEWSAAKGIKPSVEATQSAKTGELFVTTRENKPK